MKCPKCGAAIVLEKPASKRPEDVMARRQRILENPGVRPSQLAIVVGCSVDTIHRVRREYELK